MAIDLVKVELDPPRTDALLRRGKSRTAAGSAPSPFANGARLGGELYDASWLDSAMGPVSAALMAVWAYGLLRAAGHVLLDAEMGALVVNEMREVIALSPSTASIFPHPVWRIGKGKYACIVSFSAGADASPDDLKRQVPTHAELVHTSVEVNRLAVVGKA